MKAPPHPVERQVCAAMAKELRDLAGLGTAMPEFKELQAGDGLPGSCLQLCFRWS